jgi:hypothetical protein
MVKSVLSRKPNKKGLKCQENNFIDQMHKRITKNTATTGSKNKLATNLGAKTNFNSARRHKISISNSPRAQFTKRPDSRGSDVHKANFN